MSLLGRQSLGWLVPPSEPLEARSVDRASTASIDAGRRPADRDRANWQKRFWCRCRSLVIRRMPHRTTAPDERRLCEWALLTGDRLPEEYGPCGPETERE